ncbi:MULTISPECIES: DUF2768 domain-containing protein [Alteribacter]|uniref:DUF2768 domain-containing protein n=1 Tax=Alteribacter keqinensis TaxID=2483800 RepID=A0A3M7TUK7_9BACI|nr:MULTISPECIES: DUF2768 domain-containing protein [Alteribacter]MBM7094665.1 DUF2768 domain-containing protein [Alteribacter salitolerans]RNA69133.1 DUF2768 domain-containing protein [Alteribacter keqinensis]
MDDGLTKMWVSFFAMGLMFVSVIMTIVSREKLKGWVQRVFLTISFICMIVAGFIIFVVVFTGPVPE